MKYILFAILAFSFISCSQEEESTSTAEKQDLKDNFKISGKITNGQNLTFYLEAQSQNGVIEVAKAKSDATGRFEMIGNIPDYGMYSLRMGETPEKVIPLTLVPNDEIQIKATYASYSTPTITGASWTSVLSDYMKVYKNFVIGTKALELNQENLSDNEINKKYQILRDSVDMFALDAMTNDPGNPFNYMVIASALPGRTGFNGWNPNNLELLKRVENALVQKFPKSPIIENLGYQVYQIQQEYDKHLMFNSGTQPAPEIALAGINGEEVRLSDLKGQYVLIDFWASWCKPCRLENPNVVRLYNKYKNKGFTVLSVSLDENPDQWKAAILKDNLSWSNHCSDLQGWNSSVIQDYGFTGIPYTVLLNKEGNFIGVNLRGADLEQKLKEIFEN